MCLRVSNSIYWWSKLTVKMVHAAVFSLGRFGAVWEGAKTTKIIQRAMTGQQA